MSEKATDFKNVEMRHSTPMGRAILLPYACYLCNAVLLSCALCLCRAILLSFVLCLCRAILLSFALCLCRAILLTCVRCLCCVTRPSCATQHWLVQNPTSAKWYLLYVAATKPAQGLDSDTVRLAGCSPLHLQVGARMMGECGGLPVHHHG